MVGRNRINLVLLTTSLLLYSEFVPADLDEIHRLSDRAKREVDDLYAVLDEGHHVGTVATVFDGEPWVVPMLYSRVDDRLFLHGSSAAGALRDAAGGASVA